MKHGFDKAMSFALYRACFFNKRHRDEIYLVAMHQRVKVHTHSPTFSSIVIITSHFHVLNSVQAIAPAIKQTQHRPKILKDKPSLTQRTHTTHQYPPPPFPSHPNQTSHPTSHHPAANIKAATPPPPRLAYRNRPQPSVIIPPSPEISPSPTGAYVNSASYIPTPAATWPPLFPPLARSLYCPSGILSPRFRF